MQHQEGIVANGVGECVVSCLPVHALPLPYQAWYKQKASSPTGILSQERRKRVDHVFSVLVSLEATRGAGICVT